MSPEERIQRNETCIHRREEPKVRRKPLIVFSACQTIGATHASPLLQQPSKRHSLWKTNCVLIVPLPEMEVINVAAVDVTVVVQNTTQASTTKARTVEIQLFWLDTLQELRRQRYQQLYQSKSRGRFSGHTWLEFHFERSCQETQPTSKPTWNKRDYNSQWNKKTIDAHIPGHHWIYGRKYPTSVLTSGIKVGRFHYCKKTGLEQTETYIWTYQDKRFYMTAEGKQPIHMILGYKTNCKIKTGEIYKGNDEDPIVEGTKFGWIIHVGDYSTQQYTPNDSSFISSVKSFSTSIPLLLVSFWLFTRKNMNAFIFLCWTFRLYSTQASLFNMLLNVF